MKSAKDPRHLRRRQIVRNLFSQIFLPSPVNDLPQKEILKNQDKIDKLIQKAAPEWPINKINKIDLAILRLAVWELTIAKKEPKKVIIDEAIELAKEYGSESSPSFINGTLGTLLKYEEKS